MELIRFLYHFHLILSLDLIGIITVKFGEHFYIIK